MDRARAARRGDAAALLAQGARHAARQDARRRRHGAARIARGLARARSRDRTRNRSRDQGRRDGPRRCVAPAAARAQGTARRGRGSRAHARAADGEARAASPRGGCLGDGAQRPLRDSGAARGPRRGGRDRARHVVERVDAVRRAAGRRRGVEPDARARGRGTARDGTDPARGHRSPAAASRCARCDARRARHPRLALRPRTLRDRIWLRAGRVGSEG